MANPSSKQMSLLPSPKDVTNSSEPPSPLGSLGCLPIEIRMMIWKILFAHRHAELQEHRADVFSGRRKLSFYFFYINKHLSAEISEEFYGDRTMILNIDDKNGLTVQRPDRLEGDPHIEGQHLNKPGPYDRVQWAKLKAIRVDIDWFRTSAHNAKTGYIHELPTSRYFEVVQHLVRKLATAPFLPPIVIDLRGKLPHASAKSYHFPIFHSEAQLHLDCVDLILSPLRSLTGVESFNIRFPNGYSLPSHSLSLVPRSIFEMVGLPKGGLTTYEQEVLANSLSAIHILMELAVDGVLQTFSGLQSSLLDARMSKWSNYLPQMVEKIDACGCLPSEMKIEAYTALTARSIAESERAEQKRTKYANEERWSRRLDGTIPSNEVVPLASLEYCDYDPSLRFKCDLWKLRGGENDRKLTNAEWCSVLKEYLASQDEGDVSEEGEGDGDGVGGTAVLPADHDGDDEGLKSERGEGREMMHLAKKQGEETQEILKGYLHLTGFIKL